MDTLKKLYPVAVRALQAAAVAGGVACLTSPAATAGADPSALTSGQPTGPAQTMTIDGAHQNSRPSALRPGLVTRDVQQNLAYQLSAEHMARVSQLLQRALQESEQAEFAYAVPGFAYGALRSDIEQILAGVEPLLAPEKRRLRYQTLTPDGLYFQQPAPVSESTTPGRKAE